MTHKQYDSRVKFFLKRMTTYSEMGVAESAIKATRLLLDEVSIEKGFERHDGRDYFVHPIAIAQTAIDFGLVKFNIGDNLSWKEKRENEESDTLLTACLLHDIIEDVEWVTPLYVIQMYGLYAYNIIDNVTKREGEVMEDYIDRFSSERLSALVKILDRLNNVSTLSNSSYDHRVRQLEETKEFYLPLTKQYRHKYFEDAAFYWQARTIMNSILLEVERGLKFETLYITEKDE